MISLIVWGSILTYFMIGYILAPRVAGSYCKRGLKDAERRIQNHELQDQWGCPLSSDEYKALTPEKVCQSWGTQSNSVSRYWLTIPFWPIWASYYLAPSPSSRIAKFDPIEQKRQLEQSQKKIKELEEELGIE